MAPNPFIITALKQMLIDAGICFNLCQFWRKRMKKRVITNQMILEALLSIDINNPPVEKAGICEYVLDYICNGPDEKGDTTETLYNRLSEVFQKWPLARSNTSYPVEGVGSEFWRAVAQHTLWQNPRRIELLQWAIEYFKGVCDAEME